MICSDLITLDNVRDYLDWELITKDDIINMTNMFQRISKLTDSTAITNANYAQNAIIFLLYNEYVSFSKINSDTLWSAITSNDGVKALLANPYSRIRKKYIRDYILNMTYSKYGNQTSLESQLKALDSMLTAEEKTFLSGKQMTSTLNDGTGCYCKYFIRVNGQHADVETQSDDTISVSPANDKIQIASDVLNAGNGESVLLQSVLRKIRAGTID